MKEISERKQFLQRNNHMLIVNCIVHKKQDQNTCGAKQRKSNQLNPLQSTRHT